MTLPLHMRALAVENPGPDSKLVWQKRPLPMLDADEVLIRVKAAGVNRADLVQRSGKYPPPPGVTDIPGLECSGVIEALGVEVSGWHRGDEVCALLPGGGYAEYVAAPAAQLLPVPEGLGLEQAAALPETCATVWFTLKEVAGIEGGQSLLVHGGASGIGTTAVWLASRWGARVYTTAGTAEKCMLAKKLGAALALDYKEGDWPDIIAADLKAQGREGIDVILDMVGGDYVQEHCRLASRGGRLITIASLGGAKASVPMGLVLMKNLILQGVTLRSQPPEVKAALIRSLRGHVWPMIESEPGLPVMDRVFPADEAEAAHRHMQNSAHRGKIVLTFG